MQWRRATETDFEQILDVIQSAKSFMADIRLEQWHDGYPTDECIKNDISDKNCYVMTVAGEIIATVMVGFDGENTYNRIYDGRWRSFGKFACIHRLAVKREHMNKGVGTAIMTEVEKMALARGWHSLRCDTHENNIPMQRLLIGFGFDYCGIIKLENGAVRLAFEKLI